jgi:hypothetical protein
VGDKKKRVAQKRLNRATPSHDQREASHEKIISQVKEELSFLFEQLKKESDYKKKKGRLS